MNYEQLLDKARQDYVNETDPAKRRIIKRLGETIKSRMDWVEDVDDVEDIKDTLF